MRKVFRVVLYALAVETLRGLFRFYRFVVKTPIAENSVKRLTRDQQYWGTTDFERMTGAVWRADRVEQMQGVDKFQIPFPGGVTAIFDKQGNYLDTALAMEPYRTWN